MSNTRKWVEYAVEYGANAIETDIYKDGKGVLWAFHDGTTSGTPLAEFLAAASEILRVGAGQGVVLWIFDLKDGLTTDDVRALLTASRATFPDRVWRFLCVTKSNAAIVEPLLGELNAANEGINYDAHTHSDGVSPADALAWKDRHGVANFLYSAGISERLRSKSMWKRLNEAVALRHRRRDFGVYVWNFEEYGGAAETLGTLMPNGVMGNMNRPFGNMPARLGKDGLRSARAATRADGRDAFAAVPMPAGGVTGPLRTGGAIALFAPDPGLFLGGMRTHYNANQGADEYYPTLQAMPVEHRLVHPDGAVSVTSGLEVEIRTVDPAVGEHDRLGAWSTPTLYYYKTGWQQQRWFVECEGPVEFGKPLRIRNKHYTGKPYLAPTYSTPEGYYYLTTQEKSHEWLFV